MKLAPLAADSDAFKQAMQRFAGAVTIVTGRGYHGERLGMTATAVMSLSADPPSVIISLNRESRLAKSLALGARIGVNVLAADQEEEANMFGGARWDLSPEERFAAAAWGESDTGLPLLDGALVQMECIVDTAVARATHLVYFCVVSRVLTDTAARDPLLYYCRNFSTLDHASRPEQ